MTIRIATIEDGEHISDIIGNELGYECDEKTVREQLKSINYEREIVYVAENNNDVVGFVHAEKFKLLYKKELINIQCLAVKKEYQGSRIGSNLLDTVEKWAKDKGVYGIRLNSAMTRIKAHEFYRNKGFVEEREQIRFFKKII